MMFMIIEFLELEKFYSDYAFQVFLCLILEEKQQTANSKLEEKQQIV